MTAALTADIIDILAGLGPGHDIATLRGQRAQARDNAQLSFAALLEPKDSGDFTLAERYAVALFVSQLHGFPEAVEFYADLLGDEAPELVATVAALATDAAAIGPVGNYREPGLHNESIAVEPWAPTAAAAGAIGHRLAAALSHTHLLVIRPREASADALSALVRAGWSADDIVSLSQLVAFLSFQLRSAWGLRVLAGVPRGEGVDLGTGAGADARAVADAAEAVDSESVAELITEYPDLNRPDRFTQQSLGWVPWLAPVDEADLTPEQRDALVDPLRAKMPYFRLLARDPEALRARTLTDLDIFFNTDGGIGRAERELAATAASRHNGCVFCASVHSAAATRESGRESTVQALLDEGVGADLGDAKWNAVVSASVSLTNTPLGFGEADIAGLRAAGLSDAEIIDVINGAAFFNWANRLMLSLGEPEVPAKRGQ
ncbi:alkylhydroperoxidase domain protein [Leucobacter sp. NPDC015123]|uniref:alkylhydroperoxidase domain protein n=1 Tax=Leucobacter sp. NPDC015123 TaxID=3364129 RepID=UPI0036F490A9